MLMGGLFGFSSGSITPDFFRHIIPWRDVQPVGFATFCGATAGVILGGGLGCFGVLVQAVLQWRREALGSTKPVEPTGLSSSPADLITSDTSGDPPGGSLRRSANIK